MIPEETIQQYINRNLKLNGDLKIRNWTGLSGELWYSLSNPKLSIRQEDSAYGDKLGTLRVNLADDTMTFVPSDSLVELHRPNHDVFAPLSPVTGQFDGVVDAAIKRCARWLANYLADGIKPKPTSSDIFWNGTYKEYEEMGSKARDKMALGSPIDEYERYAADEAVRHENRTHIEK